MGLSFIDHQLAGKIATLVRRNIPNIRPTMEEKMGKVVGIKNFVVGLLSAIAWRCCERSLREL